MKKLVKFTTREVVREVEKEIELPAYFVLGGGKPSDAKDNYFNIVKVTDPNGVAEKIEAPFIPHDQFFSYGRSPWVPSEIASDARFIQVDESEWDIAVEKLIKGVKNGGV